MAAITDKDIYKGKPNPLEDVAKGTEELIELSDKLILNFKELGKISKDAIVTNSKKDTADFRRLSEDQSKLNKANKAASQIIKEKNTLELKLKKLNSDKIQQNEQLKVQVQTQRKLNKELARDQLKLVGAFEKLTKKTNEAQRRFKNLATQFGANSKQAKRAKIEFEQLDNKLAKVNRAARDGRRDVGQYAKGFAGLKKLFVGGLGILGVTAGFSAIRSGITKMLTTFSDFEKQVSKVGAISGASQNDLKALTAQAQALGEATEKTASEVAQLQLELAKLGFDPKQIQAATDSILDLSTAVDADLGESAKVVGATLRAFGLEAEETSRVTDVMALSFSRSSLDIQKFSQAMSTVAPVAKAFGFSIEDTTALLAQLTDAGFDASAAGTATRNILLNLADTNGKLAKKLGGSVDNMEDLLVGLEKLNKEGVDLNETLQLTDKRSVAAFNRFINATDQTRKLTKELENAGGAASRMATIMRDNLSGDTDKAKSAIQGLFINIGNRLNPSLRKATQNFTDLVGKLNELVKVKASEEIEKERTEVIKLTSKLQDANTSYEDRVLLLEQLNELAPDVVENINAEEIAYEDLNKQLDQYLEKTIERIALAELEQDREEELIKIASIKLKQTDVLLDAQNALLKVSDEFRVSEGTLQDQLKGTIKLLSEEVKAQEEAGEAGKIFIDRKGTITDARTEEQKQFEGLRAILGGYNKLESEANDISKTTIERINEKIRILKEQLGITIDLNEEDEEAVKITDAATAAIIRYTDAIAKLEGRDPSKIKVEFQDQRTDIEKILDAAQERSIKHASELNKKRIQDVENRNKTIEELESKHYDSLLDIAFNLSNRKKAQDATLSNDELNKIISDNERTKEAYEQLADTLINIANSILQTRLNNIDREIERKNQQIDEQQQALNRELQLQQSGAASNVEIEEERLKKLQAERDKDIKERERLQKKLQVINALIQVSELVTAVAIIINSASAALGFVGVVAGLAAAAAAIVGFTTYKGEAESAVSAEDGGMFTKTGTHIEKGKRHSQGGNKYSSAEFEKDEIHSIFSRKASNKYGGLIEDFTDAANSGSLSNDEMQMYQYSLNQLSPESTIVNNNYGDLLNEMRNVSRLLSSRKTPVYDPKGNFKLYDNYGMLKKFNV